MKIFLMIFLLKLFTSAYTYAQNQSRIDSLHHALQQYEAKKLSFGANAPAMMDTTKVLLLNDLNREIREFDLEEAVGYAKECLEISTRLGYKKGIAHGYNDLGLYYYGKAKYKEAETCYNQSLTLRLEINDVDGVSACYNNLGLLFRAKGDDAHGLSYYYTSLRYSEANGSKRMMAATYHNMGMLYTEAGNLPEAAESFTKAKKINAEIGNKIFLNYNLTALSGVYVDMKQYKQVIAVNKELLDVNKEFKRQHLSIENATIGNMYYNLGIYTEAIRYNQTALEEAIHFQDTAWQSQIHLNLGKVYHKQNNNQKAISHLKHAIMISDQVKRSDLRSESLEILADIYGKQGNFRAAWQSHTESVALKDTTDNSAIDKERVNKLTHLLMQSSFDKQRDSTQADQDKKDARQLVIRNSMVAGLLGAVVFLIVVYRQRNTTRKEKQRSDNLLLNILPAEVADELKEKGTADAKHFDNVTVLFTDFKSFTTVSEQLSPQELVNELHACFKGFDEICGKYNIEKIKTIGDAYLAVCGLPIANEKHAENVVNAALEIREFMEKRRQNLGKKTFEVRIGINSGSVVAGIVGLKKFAYDIWGDTVNTAARMEQNSEAGKINVSETTYALVKDKFTCEYRGEIDAKNKGKLKMYFVEGNV
ncbi:MAG: tetratricopeptide repeat protein [Bacteroidetes bacterium]|nr:tetratricopeptide repeat protein [Bacteroidota bacterium]